MYTREKIFTYLENKKNYFKKIPFNSLSQDIDKIPVYLTTFIEVLALFISRMASDKTNQERLQILYTNLNELNYFLLQVKDVDNLQDFEDYYTSDYIFDTPKTSKLTMIYVKIL